VRQRIEAAARRSGRDPHEIELCAVTKLAGLNQVREAVEAGCRILGENRVQAAEAKIREASDLRGRVLWHLIGHLQTNKAARALELFDAIESVDSVKLARKLAELSGKRGGILPILVEVKTSPEETKRGIPLAEAKEVVAVIRELPHLELQGLMTMAPWTSEEKPIRACFSALRELRDELGGAKKLPVLSMGMTNDFELAVEEGATLLRIGSAIFG
jgi:hypothetical protein